MVYLARLCTKVFAGPLRLRRLDVRRGSASPLRLPLTLRLRRPDVRRGSASPLRLPLTPRLRRPDVRRGSASP